MGGSTPVRFFPMSHNVSAWATLGGRECPTDAELSDVFKGVVSS